MGYYIQRDSTGKPLSAKGKAVELMKDGATIFFPDGWEEDLVCVVNNGAWDAAAYCYSHKEYLRFTGGRDDRDVMWLKYKHAKDLSGYNERIKD